MKVKHIIFWHFFAAALLLLFACNVFGGRQDKSIEMWGKGKCQQNAIYQGTRYQRKNYEIRYGFGWYDGKRHAWCEYLKKGVWVMAKDTIRYVDGGWPVEAYGGYVVSHYGYPQEQE